MSLKNKAIAERERLIKRRLAFIDTAKVDVSRMQDQIDALTVAINAWDEDADTVLKGLYQAGLIKPDKD